MLSLLLFIIIETIDTAAGILANKPPQLEDRIRENEKHNAKFCFLNPSDPYHAYYQFKLQEAREGKRKYIFCCFKKDLN